MGGYPATAGDTDTAFRSYGRTPAAWSSSRRLTLIRFRRTRLSRVRRYVIF